MVVPHIPCETTSVTPVTEVPCETSTTVVPTEDGGPVTVVDEHEVTESIECTPKSDRKVVIKKKNNANQVAAGLSGAAALMAAVLMI